MTSIITKTSQSTVSNLESGSSASRNLPRFGQRVTSEVESGFSLKQCLREIGLWFRELPGKIKNFFITCCRCTCCCPEDSLLIGQSNAVVLEPETQSSSLKQDSIKHALSKQSAHTSESSVLPCALESLESRQPNEEVCGFSDGRHDNGVNDWSIGARVFDCHDDVTADITCLSEDAKDDWECEPKTVFSSQGNIDAVSSVSSSDDVLL